MRSKTFISAFLSCVAITLCYAVECSSEGEEASRQSGFVDYMEIGPEEFKGLVEALKDPDERVSASAADALGQLGSYAKAAIPDLIGLAHGKSLRARAAAYYALAEIDPEAYEPTSIINIGLVLDSREESATPVAAWSLYKLGK